MSKKVILPRLSAPRGRTATTPPTPPVFQQPTTRKAPAFLEAGDKPAAKKQPALGSPVPTPGEFSQPNTSLTTTPESE